MGSMVVMVTWPTSSPVAVQEEAGEADSDAMPGADVVNVSCIAAFVFPAASVAKVVKTWVTPLLI